MQYRTLGKTGLSVSVLGFGGAPLGGVYDKPDYAMDEAEAIRAVHSAFDRGVNYVDVTPYYGATRAESVLGKALHGVARERYLVSTKVGRYGGSAFDFSAERVTRGVEESLSRLGIETVDILLCHDIEFVPMAQIWEETLPALDRLRQSGKVRFLGFSGLPLTIFPAVIEQTDLVDVVLSYCHYNLLDTSLETLLPYLHARNIGVINASPLSMGLLSPDGPPPWRKVPDEVRAVCEQAAHHCAERGYSLGDLAVSFAVQNPQVATTLVGMATTAEVEKNVAAAESTPDPMRLLEVRRILRPFRDWSWRSGLPENDPIHQQ
ncbi:MAG: aldo/keto reductase [Armatimonadaceae bacterium]